VSLKNSKHGDTANL